MIALFANQKKYFLNLSNLDTLWESRRRHYGLDEGYQQQQHQVWLVTKIQKVCDL